MDNKPANMTDHLMACFLGSYQSSEDKAERQDGVVASGSVGSLHVDVPIKRKSAEPSGWISAPSGDVGAVQKTPTAKRKLPESHLGFDDEIPTRRGKAFWREKNKQRSKKFSGRGTPTVITFTSSEDEDDAVSTSVNNPAKKTKKKARQYKQTNNAKFLDRRLAGKRNQTGAGLNDEELHFNIVPIDGGHEGFQQPTLERSVKFGRFKLEHNLASGLDMMHIQDQIDEAYWKMLAYILKENVPGGSVDPQLYEATMNDIVSVEVMHDELYEALFITNTRRKYLRRSDFLDKVYEVSQSQKTFLISGVLDLKVTVMRRLSGGAGSRFQNQAAHRLPDLFDRRVCRMKQQDGQMCGFLCIAMAYWIHKNKPANYDDFQDPNKLRNGLQAIANDSNNDQVLNNRHYHDQYSLRMKDRCRVLSDYAVELFSDVCPELETKPMGRDELLAIQAKFRREFKLIVVRRPTTPATKQKYQPLFEGNSSAKHRIILEYTGGMREDEEFEEEITVMSRRHYNLINRMHTYYGFRLWCFDCNTGYYKEFDHSCEAFCKKCRLPGNCAADNNNNPVTCEKCGLICVNDECLQRHMVSKYCSKFVACPDCHFRHRERVAHRCGWYNCFKCGEEYEGQNGPHYCNIQPLKTDKLKERDENLKIIVAFDIESYQKRRTNGTQVFTHVANLLVAHVTCDICWNTDEKSRSEPSCQNCGEAVMTFEGDDCVSDFNDYLINLLSPRAEELKASIDVYAHNLKGYDGKFILRDLMTKKVDLDIILTGSKIMRMSFGNIRYSDSLNFFQQRLADLPKSFGFEDKALKGYFPHFYNCPEEEWDSKPKTLPPSKYFGTGLMKPEELASFRSWYDTEKDKGWDMRTELVKYCSNDCLILITALQEFRRLVRESQGLDPTTRCFTLASVCMETWRANVLGENKIGITPAAGYTGRKSSVISNVWLDMLQKFENKTIHREQRIGPYWADGLHKESKTVYEFNGCYYHGHDCTYLNPDEHISFGPGHQTTPQELLNKVEEKKSYYESQGYEYESIWECEFKGIFMERIWDPMVFQDEATGEELRFGRYAPHLTVDELKDMAGYVKERHAKLLDINRLELNCSIRKAFFGGRTGHSCFEYICKDDEFLRYVDFTSLYPHVLNSKKFPTGHPSVITENFDYTPDAYFGFLSVKVLPPEHLFLPVLPVRDQNQLLFPLCHECLVTNYVDQCPHIDSERSLIGTWTSVELYNAVQRGYKIEEIYQVYHWDEDNQKAGLFSEYIKTWLKIKQESSGWPAWVLASTDPDQRELAEGKYIQDYLENQGIELDREMIIPNKGLRNLAKLMLNSFWGKLAQRPNLPKTEIIYTHDQAMKIYDDPKLEVIGQHETGLESFILNYKKKDINDADPGNTSIALAAFVTAYARTELENLMHKINHPNMPISDSNPDECEEEEIYRCLYWDTDSVIFVERPGLPTVETGDYLGQLTDEVLGEFKLPQYQIKRAAFLGPKTYAYEVVDTSVNSLEARAQTSKTTVKCKGVTLHANALKKLNLDSMLKRAEMCVFNKEINKPIRVRQSTIRAHQGTQMLTSHLHFKDTYVSLGKRVPHINGMFSFPIGFRAPAHWEVDADVPGYIPDLEEREFSDTSDSDGAELFEIDN